MRKRFKNILRFTIRISSFISKEFFSVISQPRLVSILVLGPFLILLLFGISYQNTYQTLRTTIVVPGEKDVEAYVNTFADQTIPNIEIVDITTKENQAIYALKTRSLDLVMVVPPNIPKNIKNNEPSVFTFYHQEIDPFEISYVEIIVNRLTAQTNRDLLITSVEQSKVAAQSYQAEIHTLAQGEEKNTEEKKSQEPPSVLNSKNANSPAALWLLLSSLNGVEDNPTSTIEDTITPDKDAQLEEFDTQLNKFVAMDSRVMVEPFQREMRSLSEVEIKAVHFYVPSVLALLLQHIAISLAALSIVSERFSGTMEIMRASPATAFEILVGKYLSFLIFLGVLVAVLTTLLHLGLGVPMLGSWGFYMLTSVLVIMLSLGFGFLISSFVRSASQAVQFSMVFLLASIFFSGFFLQLYQLRWPAQIVSWTLPATYGINSLQDIMLRGIQPKMELLWIMAGMSLALFIINWVRLQSLLVKR